MKLRCDRSPQRVTEVRLGSALLAIALLAGACGGGEPPELPPPQVVVTEVEQADVPIHIELVGQTLGSVDVSIRARVEGFLEGMHFQEGGFVEKGKLLYEIDPRPLEAKVVEAEGVVAEAQTALAKADSDLRRIEPLAEMNAVSERELDSAIAQKGAAKAAVQAAEASLDYAKIQLGYTKIYAPISGIIGITQAKVGDFVGREPNPVVLNLVSDIDPIRVRFSISELAYLELARARAEDPELDRSVEDVELVQEEGERARGQELELILADGTIHPYPGEATAVSSVVDPETGTLTIEAYFPNPEEILRPGLFARVRGVQEIRRDALLVPQRSVQELQGRFRVYVVDANNVVVVREIQPGPRVDDRWIIEQGLQAGDDVIYEGLQKVGEGLTVVPVSEAEYRAAESQQTNQQVDS